MSKDEINKKVKENSASLISKIEREKSIKLTNITNDDCFSIYQRCCENILGYMQIPLGVTKTPIIVNGRSFYMPICTTEGCLVASLCRGIKLTNALGGIKGFVENQGITRSFAIECESFEVALELYKKLKENCLIDTLKDIGNSTSRYLKVKTIQCKHLIGTKLFVKVTAFTGDAMGMNMITKACGAISKYLTTTFPCKLITISDNTCTDKKWSVENYCNGRGRKVSLHIKVTDDLCKQILKVSIYDLFKVYNTKIKLGSALVLGNFNSQASNYIAAIFIALGQDLGHIIEGSNCLLDMSIEDECLVVNLYMMSLVIGKIGGGTHLKPQSEFLNQFEGGSEWFVTDESDEFHSLNWMALAIAGCVMCGELSCMAALADNTLMDAHLRMNRTQNVD